MGLKGSRQICVTETNIFRPAWLCCSSVIINWRQAAAATYDSDCIRTPSKGLRPDHTCITHLLCCGCVDKRTDSRLRGCALKD